MQLLQSLCHLLEGPSKSGVTRQKWGQEIVEALWDSRMKKEVSTLSSHRLDAFDIFLLDVSICPSG